MKPETWKAAAGPEGGSEEGMIILTMKMNVHPEKRKELLQTIFALIQPTREEQGCLSYYAFLSIEDENSINLVETLPFISGGGIRSDVVIIKALSLNGMTW